MVVSDYKHVGKILDILLTRATVIAAAHATV